jgi:hypothetical protein
MFVKIAYKQRRKREKNRQNKKDEKNGKKDLLFSCRYAIITKLLRQTTPLSMRL